MVTIIATTSISIITVFTFITILSSSIPPSHAPTSRTITHPLSPTPTTSATPSYYYSYSSTSSTPTSSKFITISLLTSAPKTTTNPSLCYPTLLMSIISLLLQMVSLTLCLYLYYFSSLMILMA